MAGTLLSVDFEVYGKVQGVLFRKHLQEMAKNNGCVGWVQNTKRGTVIGLLQGSPESVKIVKDWLKKTGSPKSRIERCVFKNEIEIKKLEHSDFLVIK